MHYTEADAKDFQKAARQIWQDARDQGGYPPAVLEAAGQGMG